MPEAIAPPLPPPSAREEAVAFDDLYRRTFARVYAYVASLMRDASAAEEVTAHAFERAYRKRASFNARRGAPMRGSSHRPQRRARRAASSPTADGAGDGARGPVVRHTRVGGPDEECRLAVRAAQSSLEPRERDLVALKFAAELGNVGGRPRARNFRVERRHAGAPRT
ncbi:MAG TPA: sigma factor [Thermoleophilaceae bacterium]|nr:sigma factor [Thermoleophilaceae bacterium]